MLSAVSELDQELLQTLQKRYRGIPPKRCFLQGLLAPKLAEVQPPPKQVTIEN